MVGKVHIEPVAATFSQAVQKRTECARKGGCAPNTGEARRLSLAIACTVLGSSNPMIL